MSTTKRLVSIAVLTGSTLISPTLFADEVELHGYFRTQVGGTSEGGNLQCFKGPWPTLAKYRLGNECDEYSELSLGLPFGDTNEAWGKYKVTLALQPNGATDYEGTSSDAFQIASRENYFIAGGFFGRGALENANVWVGKRFYNRHDIHMTDYYYWSNSGQGAGIEEIKMGEDAKFSLAYHQTGGNGMAADAIASKRVSMRFYNIDLAGKLEAEYIHLFDSSAQNNAPEGSGDMLFVEHTQNGILGGWNKVALIYGKDQGGDGFEWLPTYPGTGEKKSTSWRVHDHLYFSPSENWTGTATASIAVLEPDGGDKMTWTSFGVRPQYNFTPNKSVALELGVDQGDNGAGDKSQINKVTLAGQLTLSSGFWARPVVRVFVTHATWNDVAQASGVANGAFGENTSGTTFGAQAEAWW